ncbi:hypothetical protein [Amycolatopsis sp. lyj-23]
MTASTSASRCYRPDVLAGDAPAFAGLYELRLDGDQPDHPDKWL